MNNKSLHNRCTILRTVVIEHGTLSMRTGEMKFDGKKEKVTQPCGVPLFTWDDEVNGICRSCNEGWETEGNIFANEQERARATKSKAGAS